MRHGGRARDQAVEEAFGGGKSRPCEARMTAHESLFSVRVREGIDGHNGIRHNGNDHSQAPLENCPRCVADGLLAEMGRQETALRHIADMPDAISRPAWETQARWLKAVAFGALSERASDA